MIERFLYYLRAALLMAAITAYVFYGIGLPLKQSIGLAVCFIILSTFIKVPVSESSFTPYRLELEVNVPLILTDLGLPKEALGCCGCSYTFWAISDDLFARSDDFRYGTYGSALIGTEMKIQESIPFLTLPAKTEATSHDKQHAAIYFRLRLRGQFYELGLLLPDGWEQKAKQRFPNAIVSDHWIEGPPEGPSKKVGVPLALLPCVYLRDVLRFWQPVTLFSVLVPRELRKAKLRKIRKILEPQGWKLPRVHHRGKGESLVYIEHRYASIELRPV